MSDRRKALISIVLVAVIGGATSPITKIGLSELPPFSFAFIRFLIASIIIFPFFIVRNNFKNFIEQVPISLFASINITFFIVGLNLTTANSSQVLYAASPLLIALISHFLLKEKTDLKKYLGILVGFLGVFLIVILPLIEKSKFSGNVLGNLLICIGVLSYSFYMIFSKRIQRKYTPFSITGSFIFTTLFFLSPLFLYDLKTNNALLSGITFSGWFSLFYIAFVATIITYILNQYAIKHGGSVFASMIFYITPLFGYLSAFILLGEKLTLGLIIGSVFAIGGVFLVTKK